MYLKKLKLIVGVIFTFLIFDNVVNASEIYYINSNDVSLSQEEYDILSQFYWEGYQKIMTKEDYKEFLDLELIKNGVETKYVNMIVPYSTSVNEKNRIVKISKSCTTNYCNMSTTGTWSAIPNIRSYDVIGSRFSNVNLLNTPQTRATTSTTTNRSTEIVSSVNGFGVSILIPSTGIIL